MDSGTAIVVIMLLCRHRPDCPILSDVPFFAEIVDFSRLPITETSRAAYGRHWVGLRQPRLAPISHSRQLTLRDLTIAPRTPATSPENNVTYMCVRRGLVAGACVREGGKCRVPAPTTADCTEPAPRPTHTAFSLRAAGPNVGYHFTQISLTVAGQ